MLLTWSVVLFHPSYEFRGAKVHIFYHIQTMYILKYYNPFAYFSLFSF